MPVKFNKKSYKLKPKKRRKSTKKNRKKQRNSTRRRSRKVSRVWRGGGEATPRPTPELPTKDFDEGTKFFKGSLSISCQRVLDFHLSKTERQPDNCVDGTSIYVGPNEERSRSYFDDAKNIWNIFELRKKLTVLDITPSLWNKDLILQLIQIAIKNKPDLEEYLKSLSKFGGLLQLCDEAIPGMEYICNPTFIERLADMICIIFGIDVTVTDQIKYFKELSTLGEKTKDKTKYGWTATPSLQQSGDTSLYHYIQYYLKNMADYSEDKLSLTGQRLSYYGFDMVFLTVVCISGFPGYYFPDIASIHEDAGEELAIFRTNEYFKCRPDLAEE